MQTPWITVGFLAHVDAGKTTLMEKLCHLSFDYDQQEQARGITMLAKSARKDHLYLVDTPGHEDFSQETLRTLSILDYVVLLVNGQVGIEANTQRYLEALKQQAIPTIVFVNKMDHTHLSQEQLRQALNHLDQRMIDFHQKEEIACLNETALENYLATGQLDDLSLIEACELVPILFGSALNEDFAELIDLLEKLRPRLWPDNPSFQVYQINEQSIQARVTGGRIHTKQVIGQKIDQLFHQQGAKLERIQEAEAGQLVSLTGLDAYLGQGFGIEDLSLIQLPAYYRYTIKADIHPNVLYAQCQEWARYEPSYQVKRNGDVISLSFIGQLQKERFQTQLEEKFQTPVTLVEAEVERFEQVKEEVIGVGHYEPLRHYAEVMVKLAPAQQNQLITNGFEQFSQLDWPLGTGWGLSLKKTKIEILNIRTHPKHTQGPDLIQAFYRAIRQGLKKAGTRLLEPSVKVSIEASLEYSAAILYELESRHAQVDMNEQLIKATLLVSEVKQLPAKLKAITRGLAKFSMVPAGLIETDRPSDYDCEADLQYPTSSIFCSSGAGFVVSWDEVENYMHLEMPKEVSSTTTIHQAIQLSMEDAKHYFEQAGGRNKKPERKRWIAKKEKISLSTRPVPLKPRYFVIDGYNVIFDWESLKSLDLETARAQLVHRLVDVHHFTKIPMLVVFDGYRQVKSQLSDKKGPFRVVFSKKDQNADELIESFVASHKDDYQMVVVSSDRLIQNSILVSGATRMSSRELKIWLEAKEKQLQDFLKG